MKKWMVLFVVLSVAVWGPLYAQEKAAPAKGEKTEVILPSARIMVGGLSKSIDAKTLASNVGDTSYTAFGFTTGISEEKGSFKLGVLMVDFETTLRAGDKDKTAKSANSLLVGLAQLGAPAPLNTALMNLGVAIRGGVDLAAINKGSLPVLKPFIEDFIKKVGKMAYLRFGEWVEATRLALKSGEQGKMEVAQNFIQDINLSDYFLKELKDKGLSKGVIDSLTTLSTLKAKKDLSKDDLQVALKAVDTIYQLMA